MMHAFMQELCNKTNEIIFLHYCQQIQTNFRESDIFLGFAKPILFMGFFFHETQVLKFMFQISFYFQYDLYIVGNRKIEYARYYSRVLFFQRRSPYNSVSFAKLS